MKMVSMNTKMAIKTGRSRNTNMRMKKMASMKTMENMKRMNQQKRRRNDLEPISVRSSPTSL